MTQGLVLEVEHLDFGSAEQPVLSNLSLRVAPGELLVVLGPSGAGKSTLLNVLGGLRPGFRGRAHFDGTDLQYGAGELRLGYMFQEPRLMPWLSVVDNVRLVLENQAEGRTRAVTMLQRVGLGDWLDAFPAQLSGGMQRRVALARAFVIRPRLLLMDEPFVSLDAPTAGRLRGLLVELWQASGAAVVFVTHDLREAVSLADRLVFLSSGPGRVIHEALVDLSRPRDLEDAEVARFCSDLLGRHPELLGGRVGGETG